MLTSSISTLHTDHFLGKPQAAEHEAIPQFDPKVHLNFVPPKSRYSFTGLGLEKPYNAPDTCYTEPFQLFSEEGVRCMRREIFNKRFLDKYMRTWDRAPCYVGGFSADEGVCSIHPPTLSDQHSEGRWLFALMEWLADWSYLSRAQEASFIKQAWFHPATQAAINEAFGTPLKVIPRHCDVGYVNVQLGADGLPGIYDYTEEPAKPQPPSSDSQAATPESGAWNKVPIDAWHKDQVPVVCVVMLSDTSSMQGGETAVRLGNGSVVRARGAGLGGAVLMQSGNLEHAALRATHCPERVSMVTSYCFADPDADDSRTTLKCADYVNEDMAALRFAHLDYKLRRLRDRVDAALERVGGASAAGEQPDRADIEGWVREQMAFLKKVSWELFEREPNYVGKEVPDSVFRAYLAED